MHDSQPIITKHAVERFVGRQTQEERAPTVVVHESLEYTPRALMSFKYTAVKTGENHYVLPKVASMKTEVHAFLSDALYAASDEGLWQQIANGASYEGVTGAYLMPDTHVGFGVPVGSVIVTDDTLIQAGSGYDVNCGILSLKVPGLSAKKVQSKERRGRWISEVEKRIATGVGSHRVEMMQTFNDTQLDEILRYGAKPLGVKADVCERQYIPIQDGLDLDKVETARKRALPQLGPSAGVTISSSFSATVTRERSGSWCIAGRAVTVTRSPIISSSKVPASVGSR